MAGQFVGKIGIITGAATGIGRAAALAFVREGAKVAVADIDESGLKETLELIQKTGGEAKMFQVNVADAAQVKSLVEGTVRTYGRLDFALNNAGTEGIRVKVDRCPEEIWDKVINVNLKGVWLCMKYEIPEMLKAGGGAIVNTASVAGLNNLYKHAHYSASKHGIMGLTKTAALEFGSKNIRVNAVCPGPIQTKMIERAFVKSSKAAGWINRLRIRLGQELIRKSQPSKRIGEPEEVAEAVLWLCSKASSYMNGHGLVVDGGFLLR